MPPINTSQAFYLALLGGIFGFALLLNGLGCSQGASPARTEKVNPEKTTPEKATRDYSFSIASSSVIKAKVTPNGDVIYLAQWIDAPKRAGHDFLVRLRPSGKKEVLFWNLLDPLNEQSRIVSFDVSSSGKVAVLIFGGSHFAHSIYWIDPDKPDQKRGPFTVQKVESASLSELSKLSEEEEKLRRCFSLNRIERGMSTRLAFLPEKEDQVLVLGRQSNATLFAQTVILNLAQEGPSRIAGRNPVFLSKGHALGAPLFLDSGSFDPLCHLLTHRNHAELAFDSLGNTVVVSRALPYFLKDLQKYQQGFEWLPSPLPSALLATVFDQNGKKQEFLLPLPDQFAVPYLSAVKQVGGVLWIAGFSRYSPEERAPRGVVWKVITSATGKKEIAWVKTTDAWLPQNVVIRDLLPVGDRLFLVGTSHFSHNPYGESIGGPTCLFEATISSETGEGFHSFPSYCGPRFSEGKTLFEWVPPGEKTKRVCVGGTLDGPLTHSADTDPLALYEKGFVRCFEDQKNEFSFIPFE